MDGTPFGRYRLIELLGRGGMGEVWRAHDTDTDRIVAIKVLPAYLSENEEFQRRFRREAHAAARLSDPHVIPIHNYGEIDGRLYVDMRLIEGRDLQAVLAEGPLDPARAVRIIEQVAMALHAAHKVGLLHRDVKPSNILLDGNDFAYLIDFGIARVIDETRMTKSGNTIGTFHYIAPERLDSEIEEDARADIYSLACVLYECLTGDAPFPGDTMARLMYAHVNTPPPRPSTNQPNLPPQVDEVIATGMAKHPDQRYATTVELANAARDAITDPIARPTPSPAFLAAVEPAGNHVTAEPTLAATQLGGPPASQTQLADQPRPTTSRLRWSRQHRLGLIAAIVVTVVVLAAGFIGFQLRQPPRPAPQNPTAQPAPPPPPTSTTPPPPPPVGADVLQGLLLSPEQAAAAATSPTPLTDASPLNELITATFSDPACSGVLTFRDTHTYAGTGWTAVRGVQLHDKDGSVQTLQFLVLFPSAHDAQAFFASSAQKWQACSNQQFTVTQYNKPTEFAVRSVTNTNGMLIAALDVGKNNVPCEHALTVANNVAVDVSVCKSNPPVDNLAVSIAHQIAAKVPTT
ncbi:MAG: serine/threonine-protein kinase PknH/PknJ [Mycobacterium sp.]|uniref:serine/threonine-protein kinase PknH/PknJ n=1 Tax=Mycobacterium sp. TaxID=1785 RepID=UPI003BAE565F